MTLHLCPHMVPVDRDCEQCDLCPHDIPRNAICQFCDDLVECDHGIRLSDECSDCEPGAEVVPGGYLQ